MAVSLLYDDPVRARPSTSSAHPRYSHVPMVWPGVGVPVHRGAEVVVLLLDQPVLDTAVGLLDVVV
jgi:hypothetical protein